jgi:hypothetical protein
VDTMLSNMYAGTRKAGRCDHICCEVQLGMVTAMAKMTEFYVPEQFRKPTGKMESTRAVREDPSFSALEEKKSA